MASTGNLQRMVQRQIEGRGVQDERVLAAMRKVEREAFLPEAMREFAYEDSPLPIEEGQTISQPYIVARMAEAAEIQPGDRVLEIGAGSGYAAAVLGELAMRVYTIERHGALASLARARLKQQGYGNVDVRHGDGTLGWPDAAPFDAIIVTAGGPSIPEALKQQLAVGGRLVIPVGGTKSRQQLVRLRRTGPDSFEREDLEDVMFVPLIGAQGWKEGGWQDIARSAPETVRATLPETIRAAAHELPDPAEPAFAAAFDRWGERRVVLLGESTHGTSEFYRARAAITRRLIEHHGFNIVAVEADWPDAQALSRQVSSGRFPRWMWRNTDVKAFIDWLDKRAGFYGLDIYSLGESIEAVLAYLDKVDPEAARVARERYGCLTPWQQEPSAYGRSAISGRHRDCEQAVVATLTDLLTKRLEYEARDGMQFFDAAQNARLVASAEKYYRACYYWGNAESWNLRDRHMFETLEHLLEHFGPSSKAVVWAHNSHIGDARFTDMGKRREELNLGQLCRERFGEQAALIGLGTHAGTVAAADHWDGEMKVMQVRPSREGSVEGLFHQSGLGRGVLAFDKAGGAREGLTAERLERFIGVIYRPETELMSHYAEVELTRQFDAYLWFDETRAVEPL